MIDENARRLIAYAFLVIFGNDDTVSKDELTMLEKLALQDGIVDDAEKEALSGIFHRVTKETVSNSVWEEMERFKRVHGIE
jgi:hypothetical protein